MTQPNDDMRQLIETKPLLERLQNNALGQLPQEMTASQIRSAEILLKKTLPDFKAAEPEQGDDERQIVIEPLYYGDIAHEQS